jgi:hypothetical protein
MRNFVTVSNVNQKTVHFLFRKIGNRQRIDHLQRKIKLSEKDKKTNMMSVQNKISKPLALGHSDEHTSFASFANISHIS